MRRKYVSITILFVALAVVYLALTALTPFDRVSLAKYHISHTQAALLDLTIILPYLLIWSVALRGYLRLQKYADTIQQGKDAPAFRRLANGVLLLVMWLPVSAVMSALVTYVHSKYPAATAATTIIDNYVNLGILFVAISLVNLGARRLLLIVSKSKPPLPLKLDISFISFCVLYAWLVLTDPARQVATHTVRLAAYYLPDWLLITTVVIPRLIMWYLGLYAVYYIYSYATKVKGVLYKDALKSLAVGLSGVLVMTIVLRIFQSLSSRLAALNLGAILLVIYLLLALIAVGYVFIARGAKALQRIENN